MGGGTLEGIKILSPQELMQQHNDSLVIVGSRAYQSEIEKQLLKSKYPSDRILYPWGKNSLEKILRGHNWWIPEVDEMYAINDTIDNIIILGTGIEGQYTLNLLKHSKYKDVEILFCDINSDSHINEIENVKVISLQDLLKQYYKSIVIIGDKVNKFWLFEHLMSKGYPRNRILYPRSSWAGIINGIRGWQYFDYFEPNDNEIFIDGGCFDGNTSRDFALWAPDYENIYAFEANEKMIETCTDTFTRNNLKGEVINRGLWNKEDRLKFRVMESAGASHMIDTPRFNNMLGSLNIMKEEEIATTSIDATIKGNRVSFIKMDVEGAEAKALLGAEETIKKWKPRLALSVYHMPWDIIEIPSILLEFNADYKFALRQYCSLGTETVLYAY